jgi:hypothetical protein
MPEHVYIWLALGHWNTIVPFADLSLQEISGAWDRWIINSDRARRGKEELQ